MHPHQDTLQAWVSCISAFTLLSLLHSPVMVVDCIEKLTIGDSEMAYESEEHMHNVVTGRDLYPYV